ncbi:phosphate ABC transporter permease PstA [Oscillatoria sp. FACHB-1407]|uniref:phosphate ABC transporter permease PstA n=1 Tax=Oscillatoria sp. FACHB-1407 TaxID=2692847 RepID=UPI0016828855|nr:phosphate ABC transporter permease PstA [Oscillatoria sp. FACHB-1407]MBD2464512.1 phosphate ABC transporter permease PstA [Oscillatoria sp. FACHB-1407]
MTNSPPLSVSPLENDPVNDLSSPLPMKRRLFSIGMTTLAFVLAAIALLPLGAVLVEILKQGLPNLRWEVLVSLPAPIGMEDVSNGFGNAIVGTFIMVGLAALFSVPVGMLAAIFLSEFGQKAAVTETIRFIVTVLSGVPSIVVGVFAYGVIVFTTKQFSAIAGSFALAVVMLPIIVLSTEEALKLVPTNQRLASSALGANRLQTTLRVVVTSALPGITTGILLAIARAAGETAPLLFTALFSQNWPDPLPGGLFSPMPSMSVLIYNYANSPFVEQNQMAWTASLVLVGLVLLTSILSRLVTRQRSTSR